MLAATDLPVARVATDAGFFDQGHGRVDIAFNNAGVIAPPQTVAGYSLDAWHDVLATNATGVFLSMKHEIAQMLRQGDDGGIIVNNASVSAHVGFATIGEATAYEGVQVGPVGGG